MSTTYSAAKLVVEKELDLEEEDFIQDAEMLEYFNKSRRICEAQILGIYEDYLLTSYLMPITLNTATYALPSDIYSSKIRGIIYDNGSIVYEIKRIRSVRKFLERSLIITANPSDYYRYQIINSLASGIQLELSPPAKETASTFIKIWYLRKIAELTGIGTEYFDKEIPESLNYIYALVKGFCKQKENAGVMPDDARREIDEQKGLMVETLTNMIPDDDNEVLKDFDHYNESS